MSRPKPNGTPVYQGGDLSASLFRQRTGHQHIVAMLTEDIAGCLKPYIEQIFKRHGWDEADGGKGMRLIDICDKMAGQVGWTIPQTDIVRALQSMREDGWVEFSGNILAEPAEPDQVWYFFGIHHCRVPGDLIRFRTIRRRYHNVAAECRSCHRLYFHQRAEGSFEGKWGPADGCIMLRGKS